SSWAPRTSSGVRGVLVRCSFMVFDLGLVRTRGVPDEGNRSSNRWGRPTRLVRHGPKSTLDQGQSSSTTASHTSIHETKAKGPAACAQQDLGIRPKKTAIPQGSDCSLERSCS